MIMVFCSVQFIYEYFMDVLEMSLYALLQPTRLDILVQGMPLKVQE